VEDVSARVEDVVVGYLKLKEVPFHFREGYIEVPDARAIAAAASGRRSLLLSFDRETARALDDVELVSYGNFLLDEVVKELGGIVAYTEHFVPAVLRDGAEVPNLSFARGPGRQAAARLTACGVRWGEALVFRYKLAIASDLKHEESFPVLVNIMTGAIEGWRLPRLERSPTARPLANMPGFRRALDPRAAHELARAHVEKQVRPALALRRDEAEARLAAELERARTVPGLPANYAEDLRRKYALSAEVTLVAIERWRFPVLEATVEIDGKGAAARIAVFHDPIAEQTALPACGLVLDATRTTALAPCAEGHLDIAAGAALLLTCAACDRDYCGAHARLCEDTGAAVCTATHGAVCAAPCGRFVSRDRLTACAFCSCAVCSRCTIRCATCARAACPAHGATSRAGEHFCQEHGEACKSCRGWFDKRQLAGCSVSGCDARRCGDCRLACIECAKLLCERHAARDDAAGSDLCPAHAHPCDSCRRPTAPARRRLCRISGAEVCVAHFATCADCGRGHRVELGRGCSAKGCSARVCGTEEHACARCGKPVCDEHARPSDLDGTLYCATCTRMCGRCGASVGPDVAATASGGCHLCASLASMRREDAARDPALGRVLATVYLPMTARASRAETTAATLFRTARGLATFYFVVTKRHGKTRVRRRRMGFLARIAAWLGILR
jgi:hypothetical protein